MANLNVEVVKKDTLIKLIENSKGSKIFNSLIVKFLDTGEKKDILENATYSCAFFVTSILALLELIDRPHTTVKTAKEKLLERGWRFVSGAKAGDVIIWEKIRFNDGTNNAHMGFALNEKVAMSSSYKKKKIVSHSIDFRGKRKIISVLRYDFIS